MKNVTILLAAVAMLAGTAQADVLLYEGFNGYGSTLTGAGTGNSGFATGSQWTTLSSDAALSTDGVSLNYPAGASLTKSGERVADDGGKAERQLGDAVMDLGGSHRYYVSGLLRKNASSGSDTIQVKFARDQGDGVVRFRFGISSGENPFVQAGGSTSFGDVLTVGNTYFFVMKLESGATASLEVYGPSDTVGSEPEDGEWDVTASASSGVLLNYMIVDIGSGNPAGNGQVDEIRIGESWADVTVPEPATLALLGIGGIGVLLRRKRQ